MNTCVPSEPAGFKNLQNYFRTLRKWSITNTKLQYRKMFFKNKFTDEEKCGAKKLIKRVAIIAGSMLGILAICLFTFLGSLLSKEAPVIHSEEEVVQILDNSDLTYYGQDEGSILYTNPDQTLILEILPSDSVENGVFTEGMVDYFFATVEDGFRSIYGNASSSSLEIGTNTYRHLKMNAGSEFLIVVRNDNVIFRLSGIPGQRAIGERLLKDMGALA